MNQIIEKENIESLIYEIRGKQVMLDSDLARLYQVETKRVNEAVYRNKEKFPERFCFKLSDEESYIFLVANCDQKKEKRGGRYKNPRVFTEQGVAMLATVLKSKLAVEVSIAIMDTFVAMRKYISNNLLEQKYINNLVMEDHEKIKKLETTLKKFDENKKYNETFYNGQIYDAYSKITDILKQAKKNLIIIDRYADKTVLDMIRNLNINIILITKKNRLLKKIDIEKYNRQYNNLKIIYNDNFHDRYFILDKEEVYHCGASINHAGSRTFSINKWEYKIVKEGFINNIKTVI